MIHHVAHALPSTLLFRTHDEADALWSRLSGAPGLVALALMPNHIHLQTVSDVTPQLRAAMSGYARWRNHLRGDRGGVWLPAPVAEPLGGPVKWRRQRRYIHLNPCRARMNRDPLCWPWTTHRDSVGLVVRPVVRCDRNAHGWHAYVSGDPSVSVQGTPLPLLSTVELREQGGLEYVWDAVSSVTRTPESRMCDRGPARSLFLRAARTLTDAPVREIADRVAVTRRSVQRCAASYDEAVLLVERVAGDHRFTPLVDRDLVGSFGRYTTQR